MRRRDSFAHAAEQATRYLDGVGAAVTAERLARWRAQLGGALPALPAQGAPPTWPVDTLMRCAADGGAVDPGGPHVFDHVGGAVPAAVAADWLVTTFDQFAATGAAGPAVTLAEEIALEWTIDLLGLRRTGRALSGAWVAGTTEAHSVALAAARHALCAARGWDVEARGVRGAPPVTVVAGRDAHRSLLSAARYLGPGRDELVLVDTDDEGRMLPAALATCLAGRPHPAIVCAAGGGTDTGTFDPFREIAALAHGHGSWLHLDLASGAAAAAAPTLAHLTDGIELADSWTADAHRMLRTPCAVGLVLTGHPQAHRAAMTGGAPHTAIGATVAPGLRDGTDRSPGTARRSFGVPAWAALATLGREGVAEVVTRCHDLALHLAAALGADPVVRVANRVVYHQVLIDVRPPGPPVADEEQMVAAVLDEIGADGTALLGGTCWRGTPMLRASIADHATTRQDVDLAAAAVTRAVGVVHARLGLAGERTEVRHHARVGVGS